MKKVCSGKILLFIAFSSSLFLSAFLNNCKQNPNSSNHPEKITIMQSSVSLGDPHICSDSSNRQSIIFTVYEALIKLDNEGNYQPSLAESWKVEEDARTWTFNLRSGVKFHNGDILCADDVVATLRRVLDPAIGGAFGTQGVYISYLGTAKILAIDDLKVQIATERPMADLLDLLNAMPISPRRELHKLPHEYVGSGPYKIMTQTENSTILKAHDEYWWKPPEYREIHWIAERNPEKRTKALLGGRADIVSGLSLQDTEQIKKSEEAEIRELESGLCIIFMCNAQKGPCRDRRVRQALNYALDMDTIIKKIKQGAATRLNGYLTPHHFGYDPETPVYPYDPEKARSLLAAAGYSDGLELVLDIPSVMPDEAPQLAQIMAEQYRQIGISVKVIEHKDRAAYSEMVRDKKINDACCFDSSPRSTYRVLREKIQSTLRGPWWQGYENKEVNLLIEKTEVTFDDSERQKIYRQIYTKIRDDAPWIFLYRPTRYWGVRSTMKDWKLRMDGLLLFN
ncbi:MAG: ABC transporter substrate-binding protein [Candidatus Aminicenantes bacterium]|jgi:peptide/nickel transport system substrate-binding protein